MKSSRELQERAEFLSLFTPREIRQLRENSIVLKKYQKTMRVINEEIDADKIFSLVDKGVTVIDKAGKAVDVFEKGAAAVARFASIVGKPFFIALLKALKFGSRLSPDYFVLRNVIKPLGSPVMNKAISLVKSSFGIDAPFTGEDAFDAISFLLPARWAEWTHDQAIEYLSNMTDAEFNAKVDQVKKDYQSRVEKEEAKKAAQEAKEEARREKEEANRKQNQSDEPAPALEPTPSEPPPDSGQLDLPFPEKKTSMGESKLWRAIKRPVR